MTSDGINFIDFRPPSQLRFLSSFSDMFPSGILASTELPFARAGKREDKQIADIDDSCHYSEDEVRLRNQLASLYRLVDKFHWSQSIYNHMTVRLPTHSHEILINPFGLSYNDITASSLVKVDLAGNVIDQGSTSHSVNQAGYVLHSALHEGRPDVQSILHLHTPAVVAVSSMKCGLLPLCQEAMILGEASYHEYQGILVDDEEKASLISDLGSRNVMILRNHGFVVCGRTIEEAFFRMYLLILACEIQVKAMSCGGIQHLYLPSKKAQDSANKTASSGAGGVNREQNQVRNERWTLGELEWQAWMRILDSEGLKTGYQYRK